MEKIILPYQFKRDNYFNFKKQNLCDFPIEPRNRNYLQLLIKKEMNSVFRISEEERKNSYLLRWGNTNQEYQYGRKYGVAETGYFNKAMFIDTIGIFQHSSLNSRSGYNNIENFDLCGKPSAKEIIFLQNQENHSKYESVIDNNIDDWRGVVLCLQLSNDKAITSITNTYNYIKFVEKCCKFYGKNLFLKFHPHNRKEECVIFSEIARKYGCSYGKTSIDIIKKCKFVISYNSSFAIDCALRNVPYVQYGRGVFQDTCGIFYSKETFPLEVEVQKNSNKLCDFLLYRYCFRIDMSQKNFSELIKIFSKSKELFPLPYEFSYGKETLDILKNPEYNMNFSIPKDFVQLDRNLDFIYFAVHDFDDKVLTKIYMRRDEFPHIFTTQESSFNHKFKSKSKPFKYVLWNYGEGMNSNKKTWLNRVDIDIDT